MNGLRRAISMVTVVGMILAAGMFTALGDLAVAYQGSGTADDPYLIVTEAQLRALGEGTSGLADPMNACYRLESDIKLSETEWISIENFSGTFDGNSHVIFGFTGFKDGERMGIFQYIAKNGIVKNLAADFTIKGSLYTNYGYLGGIAGENKGTIENCQVSGSINFPGNIAGIAGYNYGTIRNCVSSIDMKMRYNGIAGGIVSNGYEGTIEQCVYNGNLEASGGVTGGIAGQNYTPIRYCASLGTVYLNNGSFAGGFVGLNFPGGVISDSYTRCNMGDGSGSIGGFAGNTAGSITNCYAAGPIEYGKEMSGVVVSGVFSNCYYDSTLSEKTTTVNGLPLTTEEMKQQASYDGWDFEHTWAITEGVNDGYPYLRWQPEIGGERSADRPYVIVNEKQLRALGTGTNAVPDPLTAHYRLGCDVALGEEAWTPLGSENNPFNGSFDGNYHTISGLAKLNLNVANDMLGIHAGGLFGVLGSEGAVRTLNLSVALAANKEYVDIGDCLGAAAGYSKGTIENVTVSGTVAGTPFVGGVAGINDGAIRNCVNRADLSGGRETSSMAVGGITSMNNSGVIEDCRMEGSIQTVSSFYGGGICAENVGGNIRRCGVSGNITATRGGGIAATNSGTVKNCYVTGTVSGSSTAGLIYINSSTAHNCYYAGAPNGTKEVLSDGTVTNCYYNISALGQAAKLGTPLTETQMHQTASYTGFDFTNIWDINPVVNGGFPFLRNIHE